MITRVWEVRLPVYIMYQLVKNTLTLSVGTSLIPGTVVHQRGPREYRAMYADPLLETLVRASEEDLTLPDDIAGLNT
jgi:hypothetical protein